MQDRVEVKHLTSKKAVSTGGPLYFNDCLPNADSPLGFHNFLSLGSGRFIEGAMLESEFVDNLDGPFGLFNWMPALLPCAASKPPNAFASGSKKSSARSKR